MEPKVTESQLLLGGVGNEVWIGVGGLFIALVITYFITRYLTSMENAQENQIPGNRKVA